MYAYIAKKDRLFQRSVIKMMQFNQWI